MSGIQNQVEIITRRFVRPEYGTVIEYPMVVGMENQIVQEHINDVIFYSVNKLYTERLDEILAVHGDFHVPRMEIDGWYEIKNNQKEVLSLSILNYSYAYPAAHGLTVVRSLTFDINTGKVYPLHELFKPDSDYVQILSEIVREQIEERDIILLDEFSGIKNIDQDYYIADRTLVLYFQLYDITPYVFGIPYFPITVYEIQDIIREGSPLDKMLVSP